MWYRSPRAVIAGVAVLAGVATVPLLSAGPLDPPPGPVEPTGRVLIKPLIQQGSVTIRGPFERTPVGSTGRWAWRTRLAVSFDEAFDSPPDVIVSVVSLETIGRDGGQFDFWLQVEGSQLTERSMRLALLVVGPEGDAAPPSDFVAARVAWTAIGSVPDDGFEDPQAP